MGNEIIVKDKDALKIIENKNTLSDVLKPLVNEIHLFDTMISGTGKIKDKDILANVKVGDKLTLLREVNKFDECAIKILTEDGHMIGYIPEKDNLIFSRLMDAGKLLIARVCRIKDDDGFPFFYISVYLVDY